MATKTQLSKKRQFTLASKFPLLAASPSTPQEIRRELSETEIEFSRRLRRGKENRLKELTQMEHELELTALRIQVARLQPVDDLLRQIPGRAVSLLEAQQSALAIHQAETIYALDCIQINPELRLRQHSKLAVCQILEDLKLDDLGVALFRYLTSVDKSHITVLGRKMRVSRQSLWERSRRLQSKMWELRKLTAIQSLVDSIDRRNIKAAENDGPGLPMKDPLASLALDTSDVPFPSVIDAVRLGLWIWSVKGYEHLISVELENWQPPWGVISSPNPICSIPGFLNPNDLEDFDSNLSKFMDVAFGKESK